MNLAITAFATFVMPGGCPVVQVAMRHAPQGVRPTRIRRGAGISSRNNCRHHLSDLERAGLVRSDGGASLFLSVDLEAQVACYISGR